MQSLSHEQGIGLVEVLVALLLLAVAVLGFSAMQMTAIKATEESVMRTRSLAIMRGGAEMMRANPNAIEAFKSALNGKPKVTGITKDSCISIDATFNTSKSCTIEQLATRDALLIKSYAEDSEITINMVPDGCPGTSGNQERQCFVASWGDTKAKLDDSDPLACAREDGTYKNGAECFIMEAY